MIKKLLKNLLKNLLKIKLNDNEFKEYQYWQNRSYLDPAPWFVKKWFLNKYNEEDTIWVEIGPQASEVTEFLSKISENTLTYFYKTIFCAKNITQLKFNKFYYFHVAT